MNALAQVPMRPILEPPLPSEIPEELQAKLRQPLAPEAIKAHPRLKGLSSINAAFVIGRMNEVFGIGAYRETYREISIASKEVEWNKDDASKKRTVTLFVATVHGTLEIPKYGIHLENFGGSENEDAGDALKGACTDAFTKMCSHLGIGLDVYMSGRCEGEREKNPDCPSCGKELFKDKNGNGYYCWTKKEGCGSTFASLEVIEKIKVDKTAPKKPPAATQQQRGPQPPADGKITISAICTKWNRDGDVLLVQIGKYPCASHQPDIIRQLHGVQGKMVELLVSPLKSKNYGDVYQIHRVIQPMPAAERGGRA